MIQYKNDTMLYIFFIFNVSMKIKSKLKKLNKCSIIINNFGLKNKSNFSKINYLFHNNQLGTF